MKILIKKYPVDIILCMAYSLILLPIILLDLNEMLRVILGLPFILFIPGYVTIFALFPSKKIVKGVGVIERIAFSVGLSIVITSFIGLILNYTSGSIQPESASASIFIFIIGIGAISMYRWFMAAPDERFIASIYLSLPKSKDKLDRSLFIILIASILITTVLFIYVVETPKTGEKFTGIYLLGSDGSITSYPMTLSVGENTTISIGIINHEYRTISYTIEVWLINQTTTDESTNENKILYNNAWFMDKINVTLNHTSLPEDGAWEPQWEYSYTFNIDKEGEDFKLEFLLFTTSTEDYGIGEDYKDIIKQKISSAYEELHLWIDVVNGMPGALPHITAGFVMFIIGKYYFKSYFNEDNKFKKLILLAFVCILFSSITDIFLIAHYSTHILPYCTMLPYHNLLHLIFFAIAISVILILKYLGDIKQKPILFMGMLCILLHIVMDLLIPDTGIWI